MRHHPPPPLCNIVTQCTPRPTTVPAWPARPITAGARVSWPTVSQWESDPSWPGSLNILSQSALLSLKLKITGVSTAALLGGLHYWITPSVSLSVHYQDSYRYVTKAYSGDTTVSTKTSLSRNIQVCSNSNQCSESEACKLVHKSVIILDTMT